MVRDGGIVNVFKRYAIVGWLLLAMSVLLACGPSGSSYSTTSGTSPSTKTTGVPGGTSTPGGTPSVTNGKRIYDTATSASGQRITYTGGPGMMSGGMACVNCHGPEGHGGQVYIMMQNVDVPSITWPELTGQHMDHQPYTVETVKQAITQGVDPAGNPLEYPMPRWQMSASDLNDLVAFIETLK